MKIQNFTSKKNFKNYFHKKPKMILIFLCLQVMASQITKGEENPWNIKSIYELQYFNCPSCKFKNHSKQLFVDHAFEFHPFAVDNLIKLKDGSINDIEMPMNTTWIKTDIDDDDRIQVNDLSNQSTHQSQCYNSVALFHVYFGSV